MIVLAGDVGGTNARLALVEVADGAARVLDDHHYPSAEYDGLAPIVRHFLGRVGQQPARAGFGIAGPVVGGVVTTTNLPWTVRQDELSAAIGIESTRLVNDFVAVGYGIELLTDDDLLVLQAGQPIPHGPRALIGAGTGLGEGLILWDGSHYQVVASEGGHTDFGPADQHQDGLLQALRREFGHVSWERVVSGPGLVNIYRYLAVRGAAPESAEVRVAMEHDDPAAVIGRHALDHSDPLCDQALDLFVAAFGAQAANLALTAIATGGVYLAGGITPRISARLGAGGFLAAFHNKGRMVTLLKTLPVYAVLNTNVGLLGAAVVAARPGTPGP